MTKWTKEYRKEYYKKYSQKFKKIFDSKICSICGNTFTPIKINQKTCLNEECRKQYRKVEKKNIRKLKRREVFLI